MVIDNVGFDVEAMGRLSVYEFVKLHIDNNSIAANQPKEERVQWLKNAYAAIKTQQKNKGLVQ